MSAPAPAAPISVRVFAPSAHLLAPTRSAAEGALAVRQALASALAGAAETHGQEPAPPSYTRNTASTGSQKDAVVLRVPAEEVIAREAAELRLLAPSTTTTRPELDATAKLFLPSPASSTSSSSAASSSGADGSSAVEAALVELAKLLGQGVDHVDTLILAWGGVAYEGEELGFFTNKRPEQLIGASGAAGADNLSDEALNAMVALWQALPSLPALAQASFGLTSFSQPLLARFLARLGPNDRRPVVNQLNLRDCCHIPQAFSDFARQEGVRLVSNSDPSEPIELASLPSIFEPYETTLALPTASKPALDWTLKYTVLHKARGVLIDKGYILSATWRP